MLLSSLFRQLLKSGVSDNVGGVKTFSSILRHALRKERHFALVEKGAGPTQDSHRNRFRSGTRSDPFVSSVATPIMITNSDSPVKGSRKPNQFLGALLRTIA